jgi:hypothetical protein
VVGGVLGVPAGLSSGEYPEASTRSKSLNKLVTPTFRNESEVHYYLNKPVWWPHLGPQGCPVNRLDGDHWIRVFYDAIVDVSNVWDKQTHPNHFDSFFVGGFWAHPKHIEAVTWLLLNFVATLHQSGMNRILYGSLACKREPPYEKSFTFPQRAYWIAFLLRHFKYNASEAMRQSLIPEIVGRPWTMLNRKARFREWWNELSKDEQTLHLEEYPYANATMEGV